MLQTVPSCKGERMKEVMIFSLFGYAFLLYGVTVWTQTMTVATSGDPNKPAFNPRSHTYPGNDIVRNNATDLKWMRNDNGMTSRDPCF